MSDFLDNYDKRQQARAAEADSEMEYEEIERPRDNFLPDEDGYNERVTELCGLLLANGYIHKQDARDLMYDQKLRVKVEERLDSVGMKLVHNSYAEYWGVILNNETAADERLEWSNNFGLERGAMALLLIIWSKLILPKRLAQEERIPEDGSVGSLFPEIEKMPNPRVNVSRDQIIAEFGDVLGGVSMTSRYIAQLARAKLIKAHGGVIEEGPLLPLVIDEARLTDELRREVLLSLIRRDHEVRKMEGGNRSQSQVDDPFAEDAPEVPEGLEVPTPELKVAQSAMPAEADVADEDVDQENDDV